MRAIQIYRLGNYFHRRGLKSIARFFQLINYLLHNSTIPSSCSIGKETRFGHSGIGVVIHSKAKIGEHCLIGQGITVGGQDGKSIEGQVPIIEDNVFIGPGARILGNIRIGHDSLIGANAVVTKNVEPFSVIAGVPARRIAIIDKANFDEKYRYYYGLRHWCDEDD